MSVDNTNQSFIVTWLQERLTNSDLNKDILQALKESLPGADYSRLDGEKLRGLLQELSSLGNSDND